MAITKATASSIAPAAKGDLVVGSATNDAAVLGVGSNDQVLTADSSTATGLKWATPSSGGMTLISTTTLSGTTTISSIPTTYNNLQIQIFRTQNSVGNYDLYCFPNNQTLATDYVSNRGTTSLSLVQDDSMVLNGNTTILAASVENAWTLNIFNYASTTAAKPFNITGGFYNQSSARISMVTSGICRDTSAITSLVFQGATTGTVLIYGVK